MITLPDSLLAYRDPKNKPAVDRALVMKRTPGALTVDQAREFYRAKSLGETAKIDFWCFLYDVWRETWGKAIGDLKPIPLGDRIWEGEEYGPIDSWQEGRMIAAHRLDHGQALFTGIEMKGETGIRLTFSIWKPSGHSFANVTSDLKLNGAWKLETSSAASAAGPAYYTAAAQVAAKDKTPINLEKLVTPAADALKAIKAMPGPKPTPPKAAKAHVPASKAKPKHKRKGK